MFILIVSTFSSVMPYNNKKRDPETTNAIANFNARRVPVSTVKNVDLSS